MTTFVCSFDFFNTLIGYIQSRGRARQPNSKYIIFMEEENNTQKNKLLDFRKLEDEMKEFCRELPEERNMASKYADSMYPNDDIYESDDEDDEFSLEHMHIVLETKATVTLHSSVPLIHRYCGSLPSDSFTILQPVFEIYPTGDGFSCTLRLPSNAAVKEVHSEIARTKSRAKRLAALKACVLLHNRAALDNHLMPKAQKREMLGEMAPQYDENGFIIGSRRRRGVYEKRTPRFWERDQEEEEEVEEEETADEKKEALMLDTKVCFFFVCIFKSTSLISTLLCSQMSLRSVYELIKTTPLMEMTIAAMINSFLSNHKATVVLYLNQYIPKSLARKKLKIQRMRTQCQMVTLHTV